MLAVRRVGVLGGTFDPVHNGHLVAASEVRHRLGLDLVLFVPTGQPWQKSDRTVSDPEHRYRMCLLATSSDPGFGVSRVDIERSGPTYTADTLDDLRALYGPECDFFFILGADALAGVHTWRWFDRVAAAATLVGVTRPGHPAPAAQASALHVEIPALEVSSTLCRRRVADGAALDYLVPAPVVDYIRKSGLYL